MINRPLRSRRIFYCLIFAGFLVVLNGCANPPPVAPPLSKYDPAGFESIRVDARKLEIIENWQMPMEAPYIGHFQTPYPSNIVADWAASVLQPAGGSGELILDISKASMTKEKLPRETSLQGILSDQQDTKIRVELVARLMWLQPVGGTQAMVDLSANQTKTIPESSTPNEFDRAVKETLLLALKALDGQARAELNKIDNIILP